MQQLTFQEAKERIESGKIVIAVYGCECDCDMDSESNDFCGCETESIVTLDDLEGLADDSVTFVYDEVAEAEAEMIIKSLKEEVKAYLYTLLLADNNPLYN